MTVDSLVPAAGVLAAVVAAIFAVARKPSDDASARIEQQSTLLEDALAAYTAAQARLVAAEAETSAARAQLVECRAECLRLRRGTGGRGVQL